MNNQIWKHVLPPVKKADYRYKHLRLLATPPGQRPEQRVLPVQFGDVVKITMRRNARETCQLVSVNDVSNWGDVRVLEVSWPCPHCGHAHHFIIPESWIVDGKAVFVEPETEGESHE